MSLFGLMGDLDDDPFMGGHVRRMNSLMNSFFGDPFDIFGGVSGRGGMLGIGGPAGLGGELMPFTGGRNIQSPAAMMLSTFPPLLDMGNAGNGSHVSAMSTVMTMTHGPDGRPQVYQASQSVRQGPGGIRETKKTVADSRTGMKKMSIGRHVYDRGHIVEREQNMYSGDREENEEFINLEEDEADEFNKEWESRARHMAPGRNAQAAIGYGNTSGSHRRRHHGASSQLALPSTATAPPPQPPQRYVGRSSRRSAYGLTQHQQQQPSIASTIAARHEEGMGHNEEEPPTKRKKANLTDNVEIKNNTIFQQQQKEESDEEEVIEDEDGEEEVEEEEYLDDDDDEDEIEEVVDSDSEQILNDTNKKVKNL